MQALQIYTGIKTLLWNRELYIVYHKQQVTWGQGRLLHNRLRIEQEEMSRHRVDLGGPLPPQMYIPLATSGAMLFK